MWECGQQFSGIKLLLQKWVQSITLGSSTTVRSDVVHATKALLEYDSALVRPAREKETYSLT